MVDRPTTITVDLDNAATPAAAAVRTGELGLAGAIEGQVPHSAVARPIVNGTDEAVKNPVSLLGKLYNGHHAHMLFRYHYGLIISYDFLSWKESPP